MSLKQRLDRHPAATFAILSLCWVLLLYWRAFQSPFVYDDLSIIQKNSTILSLHSALSYFGTAVRFSTDFLGPGGSYYRPLTWMSFALDHAIWGLWTPGYHLTNLVLHWLNGWLGFLLLRRLGAALLPSVATCLIWLALPVNSEVVVWTSARSHCLMFFWLLLALSACCRYLRSHRAIHLAGYAAAGLCALLSHELGVLLLPLTAIVLFPLHGWSRRSAMPLAVAAAIDVVLYEVARHAAIGDAPSPTSGSLWPVGAAYGEYLGWMLFPTRMSIERSSETPAAAFSAPALVWLLALGVLVATALLLRKRAPAVSAGLAWGLLVLLPVSGIVFLYQGVAERYDYTASAGLVFAIVSVYPLLKRRAAAQRAFAAVLVLWTALGVTRLFTRLGDWSSEEGLYRSSLQAAPRSSVLMLNLGNVYLRNGDLPKAVQSYRRALAVNPKAAKAMVNLGAALEMEGNLPGAEQQFRNALNLDSTSADTYSNLATVLYSEGRIHEAAALFRKAIEINPRDASSYFNLGLLYARSGLDDIAAQLYRQALQINPQFADAQRALAALRKK